jgi:hypothetical protein
VAPHPVLVEAPLAGKCAGLFDAVQPFAGEAVIAYRPHGPFHTAFVPWTLDARGVDDKPANLSVLEERSDDLRPERIRDGNDGLGVVDDEAAKDISEELPAGLASLNGRLRSLLEDGVNKAVPGEDRGKDPSAKAPPLCQVLSTWHFRIEVGTVIGLTP